MYENIQGRGHDIIIHKKPQMTKTTYQSNKYSSVSKILRMSKMQMAHIYCLPIN